MAHVGPRRHRKQTKLLQEKYKLYVSGTIFIPVLSKPCNPGRMSPIQKERVLVCLDFKLSPCSLCSMFSFGYFPSV